MSKRGIGYRACVDKTGIPCGEGQNKDGPVLGSGVALVSEGFSSETEPAVVGTRKAPPELWIPAGADWTMSRIQILASALGPA